MSPNTLLLRLAGSLHAYGTSHSRLGFRPTEHFPKKSSLSGILCACEGLDSSEATVRLLALNSLKMGIREDQASSGFLHDFGTNDPTNASSRLTAAGEILADKPTITGTKSYLQDASFLVALQGDSSLILELAGRVQDPIFNPYLGRKCCPLSARLFAGIEFFPDLLSALSQAPVHRNPRFAVPDTLSCEIDADPNLDGVCDVRADVLMSFEPHQHTSRFVKRFKIPTPSGRVHRIQDSYVAPPFCDKDKNSPIWTEYRNRRLTYDDYRCVVCGHRSKHNNIHHVFYAWRLDPIAHLRTLCADCHIVVSELEWQYMMQRSRIDPLLPKWRSLILRERRRNGVRPDNAPRPASRSVVFME